MKVAFIVSQWQDLSHISCWQAKLKDCNWFHKDGFAMKNFVEITANKTSILKYLKYEHNLTTFFKKRAFIFCEDNEMVIIVKDLATKLCKEM